MGSQPGIVLYQDNYRAVREILSQDQKGDLLDALMDFGETGEPYTGGDQLVSMAFNIFSEKIRQMEEKYQDRCNKNAENIRKRWREKNIPDSTEYDRIGRNTTEYDRGENKDKTKTKTKTKPKSERDIFTPPTVEEVAAYCKERGNAVDAESFVDYYEARGWELKPGQKMRNWQASVRTWEKNQRGWKDEHHGAGSGDRVRGQRELYGL